MDVNGCTLRYFKCRVIFYVIGFCIRTVSIVFVYYILFCIVLLVQLIKCSLQLCQLFSSTLVITFLATRMGSKTFVGQLPEFNSQTDSFKSYVERANLFFDANSIAEGKQLAVFLSSTYDLLRSLVAPDQPKDKSLADIIAVLQEHFDPKPATIAERFQFHRRDQLPGESVADYVAELRRLSTNCEFGGHLNDALRDRLSAQRVPKRDCWLSKG